MGIRFAPAAFAAGLAFLGSCGGGGGSANQGDTSGGPPLTHDVTIEGDLRLHAVHVHQDFFHHSFAPDNLDFYWDLFNTSPTDLSGIEWSLKRLDDGVVIGHGTISAAAHYTGGSDGIHGTGHDHVFAFVEPSVGTHDYLLTIDPGNRVHEADEGDNTYIFRVTVPTDPGQSVPQNDLHYRAKEAHFHDYDPGLGQLDFHFVAENTFAIPVSNVKWRLRCPSAGFDQTYTFHGQVDAGKTFEDAHGVTVAPGEYDFEMTLDPDNEFPESVEGDNTRVFHVVVPPATGG